MQIQCVVGPSAMTVEGLAIVPSTLLLAVTIHHASFIHVPQSRGGVVLDDCWDSTFEAGLVSIVILAKSIWSRAETA